MFLTLVNSCRKSRNGFVSNTVECNLLSYVVRCVSGRLIGSSFAFSDNFDVLTFEGLLHSSSCYFGELKVSNFNLTAKLFTKFHVFY